MNLSHYHHINLNSEYEFKYHCAQRSVEAFENTLAKKSYPLRFHLFALFIHETICTPFYLAGKLGEIALNIFRIISIKVEGKNSLSLEDLSNMTTLMICQILIPITCIVIRVSATILGFICPRWAIQGWKLAENGESLLHLLWAKTFQKFHGHTYDKQACVDILPSNAFFYLGEKQTRISLEKENDSIPELEIKINTLLGDLLQILALNDPNYFKKLVDYELAIAPKIDGEPPFYPPNDETRKILIRFKKHLKEEYLNVEELFDRFWEEIPLIEDVHLLFNYVYFNLHAILLEKRKERKLNSSPTLIEAQLMELRDLFSQRLQFGRAHFAPLIWNIHCYPVD